jgi:hypothetical protein
MGLWQWLYLGPVVLVARRRGASWLAAGLVASGVLVVLFSCVVVLAQIVKA